MNFALVKNILKESILLPIKGYMTIQIWSIQVPTI